MSRNDCAEERTPDSSIHASSTCAQDIQSECRRQCRGEGNQDCDNLSRDWSTDSEYQSDSAGENADAVDSLWVPTIVTAIEFVSIMSRDVIVQSTHK